MLTKEECLEAYEKLKTDQYLITEDDDGNLIHINNLYKNELNLFKNLINEHFDNSPLKFEELKLGMWVFDLKEYIFKEIEFIYKDFNSNIIIIGFDGYDEELFEENRFYRKQVEE